MRRFFEAFSIGMASLWLCAAAFAADPHVRVVVYGDSLMGGYQLQPEEAFAAKLDRKLKEIGFTNVEVTNMSVVGKTTTEGMEDVNALIRLRPSIVILELGANDAAKGIDVNLIHRNLSYIIGRLMAERIYIILVGVRAPSNMDDDYAQRLAASYDSIARHYSLPFYPDILEGISGRQEMSLADGYHPNAKGVDVMVEGLYRIIDAAVRWKLDAIRYEQEYNAINTPVIP